MTTSAPNPRGAPAWRRLQARFARRGATTEESATLCLHVSETGWRATLLPAEGGPPEISAEPGAAPDQPPASPVEVLRRAVRTISPTQRERIGQVRLLVTDPAICMVDNRAVRIRTADPVVIRQAGAQELGSKGALFAFQPFGRSSEHEVKRGIYAFISTDRVQDYLVALGTLAVKLVALVPIGLHQLTDAQGPPFATLDIRATSSTLVLADPETGAFACRELAIGTRSFAAALSTATAITVREAAEGLERRACFRADAAAVSAPAPQTATERALHPILAALRTELLGSVEYFVYQRLAGAPERLVLAGEAGQVRGLAEWIGAVLELPPGPDATLQDRFVAATDESSGNLLTEAPKGLLKIGKVDYRFADGRFRADQPVAARPGPSAPRAAPALSLLREPLSLARLRGLVGSVNGARAVLPVAALLAFIVMLWLTAASRAGDLGRATDALAQGQANDVVLRAALAQRVHVADEGPPLLFWTEKLLALARAVPDGMWLTKVQLVSDAGPGRHFRLVLEGTARIAGDDYLARINGLIDRLSADASFMRDVTAVSFDGAAVARGADESLAHFTVGVMLGAVQAGHG